MATIPVSSFRPAEFRHVFLLSSPTHFVGECLSEHFLLTHAWPSSGRRGIFATNPNDPTYRNFFTVAFSDEQRKREEGKFRVVPTYEYVADVFCVFLSLLFGKRFDSHGCLQRGEHYGLPMVAPAQAIDLPQWSLFNSKSRKDVGFELNFAEVKHIASILDSVFKEIVSDEPVGEKTELAFATGKFYWQALHQVSADPEVAFLNLVTAGEVLSSGFAFTDDELFDDETRNVLNTIKVQAGQDIHDRVKGRMYQVRRKFRLTLSRLLNDDFFSGAESQDKWCILTKEKIESRINAAYDLRSRYLHTGARFGGWIQPTAHLWEVAVGQPVVEPADWKKILSTTPTFIGLERLIRFALLRFIHLHISPIDERLN
jgi:hypothetical protein